MAEVRTIGAQKIAVRVKPKHLIRTASGQE
jgi:hypothetical protein